MFVSVNAKEVKAIYLPPPILLNLRFRQNSETRLSTKQLEQIKKDGNTATLFIHGYNVSLGHIGKFPQSEDFGELQNIQTYHPPIRFSDLICIMITRRLVNWRQIHSLSKRKRMTIFMLSTFMMEVDLKVNGHKALGWFHMLNII